MASCKASEPGLGVNGVDQSPPNLGGDSALVYGRL